MGQNSLPISCGQCVTHVIVCLFMNEDPCDIEFIGSWGCDNVQRYHYRPTCTQCLRNAHTAHVGPMPIVCHLPSMNRQQVS